MDKYIIIHILNYIFVMNVNGYRLQRECLALTLSKKIRKKKGKKGKKENNVTHIKCFIITQIERVYL